eukprot:313202-Prymnesium_polylepis.1
MPMLRWPESLLAELERHSCGAKARRRARAPTLGCADTGRTAEEQENGTIDPGVRRTPRS